MKAIIFVSFFLFQFSGILNAQNGDKRFIIEKKAGSVLGGKYLYYRDVNFPYNYQAAKDENNEKMGYSSFEDISLEKLSQITRSVFTPEEIARLRKDHCAADCIVSSSGSGKIVSVSFVFNNWQPVVDMEKLFRVANLIKEEITIKLFFQRKIKQEGYYSIAFPIYLSPMKINLQNKTGDTIKDH